MFNIFGKKIKVALLVDEFFGEFDTPFGGYGFLAKKYIAEYLPCKNIELDILLDKENGKEDEAIKYKYKKAKVYRLPTNEEKAKKWLEKKDYDLYLSIEMTWPSYRILSLEPTKDKKLLLWIQDPRPKESYEQVRNKVSVLKDPLDFLPESANLVNDFDKRNKLHLISQYETLNKYAKELYNIKEPSFNNIETIYNPIDIDFKFDVGKQEKKNKIIFLGRIEAQKRIWLFCETAKAMPEYDFYIMGKMFRDKEKNYDTIKDYMNEDGTSKISNLHFTGHIEGQEKIDCIKDAKVLLNTSVWEGVPISWLEVLSYGTLIVSCLDNGNLPSKFGKFVGEVEGDGFDQIDKFVDGIKEILDDEEQRKQLSKEAVEYIRKKHSIKRFKKEIRKKIKEVIEK